MPKNLKPEVFTTSKIHTKKKNLLLIIEISLILLVFFASLFVFLWPKNFSISRSLNDLWKNLSLRKPEEIKEAASLEEKVRILVDKKILTITSLQRSAGFLSLTSQEEVTVIFSESKDLDDQVRTLQTALSKAKIEGKAIALVDFRFDKLVVRYR